MTIVDNDVTTSEVVLDALLRLHPSIAERADEIEQARQVPTDLIETLRASGCFRILMPTSHGGLGSDLPSAMRVFEALAGADASVAWTVMIGGGAWCDLAELPRHTFDELFPENTSRIVAGAFNPTGSCVAEGDGYRVSGRWSFASGCRHADWIYGNCIEGIVDGVPQLRIAVFSPDQVEIEDTWTVSGLSGTGSHHIHVDDVLVPVERTLVPMAGAPCIDVPIVFVAPPVLFALCIGSVAVGIARAAVADVTELSHGKVPLLAHGPLGTNPLFHAELARLDTELSAASALLYDIASMVWRTAVGREEMTLEQRARVRAAAVWVTERAVSATSVAFRWGGGTSIYAGCPLQRRLRDVDVLAQHFLVRPDTLTTAGAVLTGHEPDVLVF